MLNKKDLKCINGQIKRRATCIQKCVTIIGGTGPSKFEMKNGVYSECTVYFVFSVFAFIFIDAWGSIFGLFFFYKKVGGNPKKYQSLFLLHFEKQSEAYQSQRNKIYRSSLTEPHNQINKWKSNQALHDYTTKEIGELKMCIRRSSRMFPQ